jgi:hypothetical protein
MIIGENGYVGKAVFNSGAGRIHGRIPLDGGPQKNQKSA